MLVSSQLGHSFGPVTPPKCQNAGRDAGDAARLGHGASFPADPSAESLLTPVPSRTSASHCSVS